MLKNKPDFKLINLALIVLILFLLYQTGNLWMGFLNKTLSIIEPFLFAFIIAYALYPTVKWLQSKNIPKALSILIVVGTILFIFILVLSLAFPLLIEQSKSLFSGIIEFLKDLSKNYDLNIGGFTTSLSASFDTMIYNIGKYVSDGAINAIGASLGLFSVILISFSVMIYFLIDMEKIRYEVKMYLKRKNKRTFNYVKTLDHEMKKYLNGYVKVIIITLFEYTLAFTIIGHPNAMLLGLIATVGTLIPYFGGIFTNIIASITAFVISPGLFIRTVITFVILSSVDGYVINPTVYGKTNKVHPLIVISSVFVGGVLFGIKGIVISLPLAIMIIATYNFYKVEILDKIEELQEKKESKN